MGSQPQQDGFGTWWLYAHDVAVNNYKLSEEAIMTYNWRGAYDRGLTPRQAAQEAQQKDTDQ